MAELSPMAGPLDEISAILLTYPLRRYQNTYYRQRAVQQHSGRWRGPTRGVGGQVERRRLEFAQRHVSM